MESMSMHIICNICYLFAVLSAIVKYNLVIAENDKSLDGSSHADGFLRLKMSSQLDEIPLTNSSTVVAIEFESKGGALQKILSQVNFDCKGRYEGYYSDTDFGCQIFHYCKHNGLRFTFVCPAKSIFNQQEMTCDSNLINHKTHCEESPKYYYLNSILYQQRKDVIFNDPLKLKNSTHEEKLISNGDGRDDIRERIIPTVVIPINTTQWYSENVEPFWGYRFTPSKSKSKDLNNENHVPSLMTNKIINVGKAYPGNSIALPLISNENALKTNLIKESVPQKSPSINSNTHPKNSFGHNSIEWNSIVGTLRPLTTRAPPLSSPPSFSQVEWDDIDSGDKLHNTQTKTLGFKPNFADPINAPKLDPIVEASINLPPIPLAPLKAASPMVVLRPPNYPGAYPVATLYKQTEYLFGKPRAVQSAYYINPTFGATLINHPSAIHITSPPVYHSIREAASNNYYTKVSPTMGSSGSTGTLWSNFQNALSRFPYYDSSLKFPIQSFMKKQKRIDFPDTLYKLKSVFTTKKPIRMISSGNSQSKLKPLIPSYLKDKLLSVPSNLHYATATVMPQGYYQKDSYFVRNHFPYETTMSINPYANINIHNLNNWSNFTRASTTKLPPPSEFYHHYGTTYPIYSTEEPLLSTLIPISTTESSPSTYSIRFEDGIVLDDLNEKSMFANDRDGKIKKKWLMAYSKIRKNYLERELFTRKNHSNDGDNLPAVAIIANVQHHSLEPVFNETIISTSSESSSSVSEPNIDLTTQGEAHYGEAHDIE